MRDEETQQLFIPEKMKVGFQNRDGTYNGKLAYIIYFDKKGVLRKEKSWESWRDKKIDAEEIVNEPTEGFVLNKKVGGYKSNWNFRDSHVRVYDPRGFEFEISVPNLLFILRETDCSRGKGLAGKFVYAWEGTELVLLPVGSQDYQNSKDFTELQGTQVHAKDLIPGATYTTKNQENLTYLGKFNFHFIVEMERRRNSTKPEPRIKADAKGLIKQFVFWDGKDFVFFKECKTISKLKSDVTHPDFAELIDKYNKSAHGSAPVEFVLKNIPEPPIVIEDMSYYWNGDPWYVEKDGGYLQCITRYQKKWDAKNGGYTNEFETSVYSQRFITIENGILYSFWPDEGRNIPEKAENTLRLFVKTENGEDVRFDSESKHQNNYRYNECSFIKGK